MNKRFFEKKQVFFTHNFKLGLKHSKLEVRFSELLTKKEEEKARLKNLHLAKAFFFFYYIQISTLILIER